MALCASFLVGANASALEIPKAPVARVSDYAGILAPADRARIERGLVAAERETSSQVAVAVFPGLEGQDAADFTNRVFEAWRLGRSREDNGVLLAVFVAERRVQIEVGYGLEGKLTDALSRRIIEAEIIPRFRQKDWAGGIESGCAAILAATRGEYAAAPRKGSKRRGRSATFLLLLALLLLPKLLFNARAATTYGHGGIRRGRGRGSMLGGWGAGPWIGGSGGGFGGGGFSGGGFSGGGGMSGGGGAGGSW